MGATDCYFSVKGKTEQAIRKEFRERCNQAADHVEDDDIGYSGTAAEFSQLIFTSNVFNSYEEMQEFIGGKEKNVAYAFQMKIVKDTATIEKWLKQVRELNAQVFYDRTLTEKAKARIRKQVEAIYAKIKVARRRKAEKTTRTTWMVGGMVSE